MSAALVLYCDHPDCTALVTDITTSDWIARLRADEQHGWHSDPSGDYCPRHAEGDHDD